MSIPDWSIKEFHRKAWHVTKTYKQLWLLGLAVMIFAGGSNMNFNNAFNEMENSKSDSQVEAQVKTKTSPAAEEIMRLDDKLIAPEDVAEPFEEEVADPEEMAGFEEVESAAATFFKEIVTQIQPVGWLMTVFSIIGYVVIGIMIYVVGSGWSQAALILGVADASEDKSPNIAKVSVKGLQYVKTIFLVGLVPWVIFMFALMGIGLVAALVAGILQNGIVGLVVGLAFIIGLAISLIMVNATIALGSREGVLYSTGAKKAISRGWEMSKLFWGKAFWLFLRNGLIEALIVAALFLPGIIAMIEPASRLGNKDVLATMDWSSFAPGAVLLLAAAVAYFFFKTVYNVFTFTTWHLAHNVLRKSTPSLQRA
jgi:hypothetical protein